MNNFGFDDDLPFLPPMKMMTIIKKKKIKKMKAK